MTHPLEGVTRFINTTAVSSGAGATTVNLRPASGQVWELLYATGQQDDGAVVVAWQFTDPDTSETLAAMTSAGSGVPWAFGTLSDVVASENSFLLAPIVLTFDRYLKYMFTASAGAKTGLVKAIVREYRGVAVEV